MNPITVTVEPDGRVTIPGTRAGQSVTILYELTPAERAAADPLSPEEQARIATLLFGGR